MKNFYLVAVTTLFLAACDGGSNGGSGGETPAPDTTSPVVTAPSSATFAAVDATGTPATSDAIATYLLGASATDDVDGTVSVTSDAPDIFSLGDTTVTFSASDAAGNSATATTVVTVTDQTAPTLVAPADSSFVATSAAGISASDAALVDFLAQATATDNVDTAITVSNDAPTTFPIGETTVVFTAADAAGNVSSVSAVVTVTGASQSGSAEKGPLFNATVFFDYDGDKELDANEPSTLTDFDGNYALAETSDAPANYAVVVLMNADTIDSISGESYADSGVALEAVKGSSVITPMTTLYSFATSDLEEGEELSVEAFSAALGLPAGLDINTYSAFAKDDSGDYIDVAVASQVEAVAQSLMTTLEIISESIISISQTALQSGAGVSQAQAAAVAMRSLTNVIVATVAKNAEVGAVADAVDFTNVDDIAEVNAAVLESLSSGDAGSLGALLQTAAEVTGVTVDTAAAEVTGSVVLSLSVKTIAAVSQAFNDLSAESFGQVEASAVSRIKAKAVAEIASAAEVVVAAVSVQQVANEIVVLAVEDVDVSAVITLDNEASLNASIAANVQEVEAYLVTTVAPVIESAGDFVAAENQTAVGTVVATDTVGDVLTYSVSGADASALNISNSGVLSFVSAPDFETKTQYQATVTVVDSNGNAVSQAISISITDANDSAPIITSAPSFTVNENQSVIGTVVATSPSNTALTFALTGADAAALTISTDGVLGFVAVPDFEVKASYSVTVIVSDGTNDTATVITVSIVNLNDSFPVFTSASEFTVIENVKSVGTLSAIDADFDSLTFTLAGSDASAFSLSTVGELQFVAAPDFEQKTSYSLIASVSDGANSTSQNVTVTIINVDDVAPVFTSVAAFSAAENQTSIGTVTATDIDSTLVTFSVDSTELAISSGGVLSFIAAADFETKNAYSVTVTATDGTNTATQVVAVTVTDADENAPVISSSPAFSAAENQTDIGTVVATDAGSISFSISGTELVISSAGVISFASAPDYETKTTYTATVTVTDGSSLATSQTITVAVTDMDDVAPVFTSVAAFSAAENQTSIGTVTATDIDSAAVTFSVDSTELAISSGGVLSFIAAADFETKSVYSVTVTATDGTNTATQVIAVTVTDADEDAPVISSSPAFSAAENQTAIGTVVATDAGSMAFSVSGTELVISSAGVLSFASAPDYETKTTYTATVTVTDSGSLATSQNITVAVTNVDDVAPVFTSAPSFTALDSQANLGVVTATDVDSASITFSISGSELAISSAGVISFVSASDFVADATYTATVTVSDGANVATQEISIAVFLDFDGDGVANVNDTDDDGDGILDLVDDYPLIASSYAVKAPLYLARAYHDCNGNEKFDEATEPFALTETDGSYHIDGNCGAVSSFNTVVEMTPDTIDYESGESYGGTAVQLKAEYSASGSKVNTPLTTLLKHIEQFEGDSDDATKVAIESVSPEQLSLALGLTEGVNLLTFNPYAPGVDAKLAHDIETLSQKIMLATLVVTKAIEGAGTSTSGASVTDDIAHEAILDAMSKILIETIKVQEGKPSNFIDNVSPPDASLTGEAKRAAQRALKVDLADREHLVELFEFLDEDAATGHLRDALDAIGADVPVAVLTAITDKTSEIISNIAMEFDGHGESDFGSADTHITSRLKHTAADEIYAFAKGYRAYYDLAQDSSFAGVQPSAFLTLDGPTGVADARLLMLVEVEQHAQDKITDTDGDGILNVFDTDDDNDGVADTDDAFPRDPSKSSDNDSSDGDKTTLNGRVIDGYISGALAFLDLNFDGELSINEPSATSGTDGLFQFDLSDQELSCAAYVPTVVNVPVGAIDEEFGVVDKPFNLVLPPRFNSLTSASRLNVSPITSVVWEAFETELRSSLSDLTCAAILANAEQRDTLAAVLERAIADVVTHYNISEAQLFEDFIANGDDEIKAKAIKIVKGLKKSFEETLTLQAQYPNASWAKVNYYFFSSLDGDDLYPNAWYRDLDLFDGDTITKELIKVSDDLADIVRPILFEKTTVSTVNGASLREEIGFESRGGDSSAYACNYKEEVSILVEGVEYQLVNLGSESNVTSVDSCKLPNFSEQSTGRYVFYRSIFNGVDSGAQFIFSSQAGDFPALNDWTNLVVNIGSLNVDSLVSYVDNLPYGFCQSGDAGADSVTRSRSQTVDGNRVTLSRSENGSYERITTFEDGTSETELSTIDSVPGWDDCSAPDYDADGSPDSIDPDDDNDGVRDSIDAFPYNFNESIDTDGDGLGNNADTDDDNDGIADINDQYPLDAGNIIDSDGDGIVVDRDDADPHDSCYLWRHALRLDFSGAASLGLWAQLSIVTKPTWLIYLRP